MHLAQLHSQKRSNSAEWFLATSSRTHIFIDDHEMKREYSQMHEQIN